MQKKVVSVRAVVARINRELSAEGVQLKRCRPDSVMLEDYGRWYTVRTGGIDSGVVGTHHNLEDLDRGYGCLKSYEELESE